MELIKNYFNRVESLLITVILINIVLNYLGYELYPVKNIVVIFLLIISFVVLIKNYHISEFPFFLYLLVELLLISENIYSLVIFLS